MFQNLQDKLDRAFKVLKGQGSITEINVAETMKEIRKALLDADVNYKTAKTFTDDVKQKALGENVLTSISPGQLLTKIMNDELTALMGGSVTELEASKNPTVILIAGLNGAGKTTFSGKLALYLKDKKGKKPLLVAGDVYRPAAIDQLEVLAGQVGVPVYVDRNSTDPIAIAKAGVEEAKRSGHNVVIIDTAGRLAIDEPLMVEITAVKEATQPHEILFVVDSMTGQDAVNTAKTFNDRLDFTGVVLTKLDGDTRGGAALSIKSVVNKPIKFIGTGEKMDALDVFYPDRMASRILGMGDVVSLVERAQQQFDEKEAAELQKKIRKNKFDFNDFKSQIQQIKKMGNMKDLMGMIPGVGKAMKDIEVDDNAFKPIEAIIDSMTPFERENPDAIDQKRRSRIAKGSGTDINEVNKLMKQFGDMRKVMKQMSNPAMAAKLMKSMPKMPGK
ncbi:MULTISPECIES: signal recognition particle protein [Sphingobacterium]|jgi:signal recognition particle subunit SRP54|uniref:Signal recognition particle protein n=1 Tax=Sphingobacterium kitahiroshimense TaxID=470446 RepID=A0ABV0BX75_9SPHI|nr:MULTISPECIES: signal recognition particle protein [Sphingobacterium]MBB2952756.1 signal recognition particle subunit SRP54 [Sphingobacterium sp. JUb56]MCS3555572.1 signal recognition particle subunit SRP54 [Sphingobacterium sp. JUb21]MCW2261219.1 signal recognition particle subunit SRP54 [Sphingobacterium kitahiroshimense]NJI76012.1 signal recognition particle protein [Sphingobacterium sp. B16(2022)]QQD14524.1 signal recognition particle protein [Sphingobacterium sp. UDSM-2020]